MKLRLYSGEGISDELKGKEIPSWILGIIYICKYIHDTKTIRIIDAIGYESASDALQDYTNIPNPESQLACGITLEEFSRELNALHEKLDNQKWVEELSNYL